MVSLFNKKPVDPMANEPLWTMPALPNELMLEIASIDAQIAEAPDRIHVQMLETRKRQCLDALVVALQLPKHPKPDSSYCGKKQFDALQSRCLKLHLEPDWLAMKIAEHEGDTPERFAMTTHYFIGNVIGELEKAVKKIDSEKKREQKETRKKERLLFDYPGPCAPPGMKAVPKGDGTYTHVTNIDSNGESYLVSPEHQLRVWAGSMGLDSKDYERVWDDLAHRLSEEGENNGLLKADWCLVQTRLAMVAKQRYEQGEKKLSEQAAACKPSLFKKKETNGALYDPADDCSHYKKTEIDPDVTAALSTPTGHQTEKKSDAPMPATSAPSTGLDNAAQTVAPVSSTTTNKPGYLIPDEEWQEIRAELGITDGFVIDTKEKADWVAGKLQMAALEYAYIVNRFNELKPQLERRFEAIRERFEDRLEAFAKTPGAMPAGKKTLNLLYGAIGFQDRAESFSMDGEDHDAEQRLQGWIHQQDDATKAKIEAKPIPKYSRNLDAIKAMVADGVHVPGIKRTPAQPNKFFVRPSLDTLKTHIKEGKLK